MCGSCWDCEVFANKLIQKSLCTGEEMMTMDLTTLKQELTNAWRETGKEEFFVFRKAIAEPCPSLGMSIHTDSKDLSVHFV